MIALETQKAALLVRARCSYASLTKKEKEGRFILICSAVSYILRRATQRL